MKLQIITLALLLCASAQAQTVWRCGPAGNVYSDSACPAGRVVAVADTRSPAEVQAARTVAARERALAERLAADNARGDAAARPRLVCIESLNDVRQRNAEAARARPAAKPFVIRLGRPAG
jgi:Domain of unknown function (DUF4124)